MSDIEDDNFEMCGTLLDPYDEDTIPKKKAFSIEDQVATDEHGRRRFHGAFTGGFSAGFFNTVGSLEGWKPTEFKSSRSEKAGKKLQKPQDFMDAEDTGTFGIAPTLLKATSDYSNISKRKRTLNNEGPIPGDPVLFSLLQPAKETVGVRLLKRMGWKPGQGVGPRLSKTDKLKAKREHKKNSGKIYGCEIPDEFKRVISDSESDSDEFEISFAPDDYDAFIYKPKDNSFGMGYAGLDKNMLLGSHISLFNPPEFRMQDRNNKKVSIKGQAFGVGAFEEEDEDIYSRDDMSKYDFHLESSTKKKLITKNKKSSILDDVLEGFVPAKIKITQKKSFPPPILPKGFIAKHGVKLSRFEPLPETHKFYNYDRSKTTGRHDLTASERSKIINTETVIVIDSKKPLTENKMDTMDTAKQIKDSEEDAEKKKISEQAKKITEGLTRTSSGSFQPFISDPDKQKRYEIYLTLIKHGQKDKIIDIQPVSMPEWEKRHEKSEFEQASQLFKPVTGLIFDRFVAGSNSGEDLDPLKAVTKSVYDHGTPEMQEAAKRKMFGPLTRVVLPWKPHKLLCRRFNVPEPNISDDVTITSKRKAKFNVFDYYDAYQQNKNRQGPKLKDDISKPEIINQVSEIPQKNDESVNNSLLVKTEIDLNKNNESDIEIKTASTEEATEMSVNSNILRETVRNEPSCSYTSESRNESALSLISDDKPELIQNKPPFTKITNFLTNKPGTNLEKDNVLLHVNNSTDIPMKTDIQIKYSSENKELHALETQNQQIRQTLEDGTLRIADFLIKKPDSNLKKDDVLLQVNKSSDNPTKTDLQFKHSYKNKQMHALEIQNQQIRYKKIPEEEALIIPTDPDAKKDLFKAIFLSSSESESEQEDNNKEEEKLTEMKKIVMEETKPKPIFQLTKRPPSKGFFADLDLTKINKPIENKIIETPTKLDSNIYGPRLPENNTEDVKPWKPTFSKLSERKKTEEIIDVEWVESKTKEDKKEKSHKKHKKHKDKDKEKHKKHKSKHKKKKRSDK